MTQRPVKAARDRSRQWLRVDPAAVFGPRVSASSHRRELVVERRQPGARIIRRMEGPTIAAWLADLPARLADAVGADELVAATRPPDGLGIGQRLATSMIWVGFGRFDCAVPRVALSFQQPIDARALCAAWGIEDPVAVSGDTHQALWSIFAAGRTLPPLLLPVMVTDPVRNEPTLPSPDRLVVAADPVRAGRWRLQPRLTGRPAGPLPERSAGASPAYDIWERGGEVGSIEVVLDEHRTDVRRGDDPGARSVVEAMALAYPHWHGGWDVASDAELVVAMAEDRPVAGAVLRDAGWGVFEASRVAALAQATPEAGSALVDALEALVLHRGGWRLRLDSSVFLHPGTVRVGRHGYVVGPPYQGDADVPVWAQRDLRDRWVPPIRKR